MPRDRPAERNAVKGVGRAANAPQPDDPAAPTPFAAGFRVLAERYDLTAQHVLLKEVERAIAAAPLFTPRMPRTGTPFSVRMTNCGPLGWVSDRDGYRYQPTHPDTGDPWPPIPKMLIDLWREVGAPSEPQACLVNVYGQGAKMGLHQDSDEETFDAPVVSVSLGATAVFRIGGVRRRGPTRSVRLASGDVVLLAGDARRSYHGIDRIIPATSGLLADGGRINLTLRRVTRWRGDA